MPRRKRDGKCPRTIPILRALLLRDVDGRENNGGYYLSCFVTSTLLSANHRAKIMSTHSASSFDFIFDSF